MEVRLVDMAESYESLSLSLPPSLPLLFCSDLGHGEMDDTREVINMEPPSLNTTRRMMAVADAFDLILHIGDICYAEGFGGTVGQPLTNWSSNYVFYIAVGGVF